MKDAGDFAMFLSTKSPGDFQSWLDESIRDEGLRKDLVQFYFPSVDLLKRGVDLVKPPMDSPRSDDVAQMVSKIMAELVTQRVEQEKREKRARIWSVVSFVLGVVLGAVLQILLEPVLSPALTGLVGFGV